MGNEIIFARCRNVGVLPAETWPSPTVRRARCCRPAAWPMDPRKDEPYEKYGEVEFEVPVGKTGDSYDRLWVLVERMKQSLQHHRAMHGEAARRQVPRRQAAQDADVREGEVYVRTENPLGLMGYYLVGDGKKQPYRLKMRTASFSNVSVIPAMLPGTLFPDLISIMGSIFFVVGDVDR